MNYNGVVMDCVCKEFDELIGTAAPFFMDMFPKIIPANLRRLNGRVLDNDVISQITQKM